MRPDLGDAALGPQAGQGHRRLASRSDRQLRAERQADGELGDDVAARPGRRARRRCRAPPRTGASSEAIDETRWATSAVPAPGDGRERRTAGSIGFTRSSAAARYVSSTAGSLSRRSRDSQATRGCLRSAHCASNVVLPYPAGATTASMGYSGDAVSRSTSAVRATMPGRGKGARSLALSSSNDALNRRRRSLAEPGNGGGAASGMTNVTAPRPSPAGAMWWPDDERWSNFIPSG